MNWRPLFAALLLVALPALAARAQAPDTPSATTRGEERRELQSLSPQQQRALRHEQTRDDDVRRLEDQRFGTTEAQRQRSQQKDAVDELYQQVIKQSRELGAAPR